MAPLAQADHVPRPQRTAEELALFHNWATLTEELRALERAHPDVMTVTSAGKSVLGLDLWAVRLRAESDLPFGARERVYVDGGIHANEQLGMELALLFVKWLATGHGTNGTATWVLENRDVLVVPMVNPDGNLRDSRQNARLVDMNRNFPYGWGGPGSGDLPGSSTWRGPAPGSEPEVQTVMRLLRAFDPDFSQSYHTGTTMLLHPWGGNDTAVPDRAVYDRICREFQAVDGSDRFPCGDVFTTIYPATGATVDYAYGVTGAISFTYEVDDLQTIPFSDVELMERLRVPFEAQLQAFRDVHRYGNHPVVAGVRVEPTGDTQTLRVTLRNDGWLATNRTDLRVETFAGETLHAASLGRVEPGGEAVVEFVMPSTTQEVRLVADYDKNLLFPRAKTRTLDFALHNMSVLARGGLDLAPLPDVGLLNVPENAVPAAGAPFAALAAAVGAAFLLRRS